MGREQFIAQASAKALPLEPIEVDGVSFFARASSIRDVRLASERRREDKESTFLQDLARRLLDESGQPMFDCNSEQDMEAFRVVIDNLPGDFAVKVMQSLSKLDPPIKEEVDAEGN